MEKTPMDKIEALKALIEAAKESQKIKMISEMQSDKKVLKTAIENAEKALGKEEKKSDKAKLAEAEKLLLEIQEHYLTVKYVKGDIEYYFKNNS